MDWSRGHMNTDEVVCLSPELVRVRSCRAFSASGLTPRTPLDLMPPANLGLAGTKTSPAFLPPSRSSLSGHLSVLPAMVLTFLTERLPPGLLKHRWGQTSLSGT